MEAKYTTNRNYATEIKDPSGNTIKYTYNQTKGTLDSLIDAKGTATSYVYDPKTDALNSVSKSVGGNPITNSYTYEGDKIKTINHNGFSYSFNYDSFGNVKSVSAGTQSLITNNYDNITDVAWFGSRR